MRGEAKIRSGWRALGWQLSAQALVYHRSSGRTGVLARCHGYPCYRLPTLRNDFRCTPIVVKIGGISISLGYPVRHIFFRIGLEEYLLANCSLEVNNLDDLLERATVRSGVAFTWSRCGRFFTGWRLANCCSPEDAAPLLAAARQDQAMQETRRLNVNLVSLKRR